MRPSLRSSLGLLTRARVPLRINLPTGLTLAILLAQRGRSVTILERWPEPYPLPRAVHFDHEVGRILQSCGIGAGLRAISEPTDVYEWRNAAGTTLLRRRPVA